MKSAPDRTLTLAFETSCDETACAVVSSTLGADGHPRPEVLSSIVSSQIDIHKLYGGVVPEIASRNHIMAITNVMHEALKTAGVTLKQITQIAATTHPGLAGAVMVGRVFAESLATALNLPFREVNHVAGHIASVTLAKHNPPPFLSLVVSGGHTSLYKVTTWSDITLLAATTDDACGEAFDKVAKILGLPYPGGVEIEKQGGSFYARHCEEPSLNCHCEEPQGDAVISPLLRFVQKPNYHKDGFSYSGLKTAVLNYVNRLKQKWGNSSTTFRCCESPPHTPPASKTVDNITPALDIPHICASFQAEAVAQLVIKCEQHLKKTHIKTLCVSGGVSANRHLREQMTQMCARHGVSVHFPELCYCGDNAAMIAAAAILELPSFFKGKL